MTDKLNNQLAKERHNKKDMLFSFEELADESKAAKVLDKLVKIFTKAGNGVIPEDSKVSAAEMSKVKRVSGVKYREIAINFLDNQSVVLRVKESGDIYQVVLNKKVVPITHQDNQAKAIDEIIGLLNAGRTKFQAALAKQKVKLPEQSTTSRVNQVTKLTGIKDGLAAEIAQIKGETERMRGEMGGNNAALHDELEDNKNKRLQTYQQLRSFTKSVPDEDIDYILNNPYSEPEHKQFAQNEKNRREFVKNYSAELPVLTGTEKQITYGNDKRKKFVDKVASFEFVTSQPGFYDDFDDDAEKVAKVVEYLKNDFKNTLTKSEAKFWIESDLTGYKGVLTRGFRIDAENAEDKEDEEKYNKIKEMERIAENVIFPKI